MLFIVTNHFANGLITFVGDVTETMKSVASERFGLSGSGQVFLMIAVLIRLRACSVLYHATSVPESCITPHLSEGSERGFLGGKK